MKSELNTIWKKNSDKEITLFKKMSSILSIKYDVAFVEETHQQYVVYNSPSVGQNAKREISDLWIISFSPSKQRVRMTFLQAKYHKKTPLNSLYKTFKGEYFQYELLSKRPVLTAITGHKYNFPLDILSFSCCGSIGSYGVFFIDDNSQIDLAYCSANQLTMTNALPVKYAQYNINLEIPYSISHQLALGSCNCCKELISCFDIDTFTNSILNLEIGVELKYYPEILAFVHTILKQQATNTATKQLISFINSLEIPLINSDNIIYEKFSTNLLIINTDERTIG